MVKKMDKTKLVIESNEKMYAKWAPVIEGTHKALADVQEFLPKVKSNHKALLAMQLEQVEQFVLESTVSADVEQFQPILVPMLRRIVPSLIGTEIFGVQPMTHPSQLIFALRAVYTNTEANGVKYAKSQILLLADASNFAVGGYISNTADAAVGTVRHITDNLVLVEITSSSGADRFAAEDEVDNVASFSSAETTVTSQTANEALYKTILKDYSGTYTTAAGEVMGTDIKEIGFNIDKESVVAKTVKMKSSYTREMAEDLSACHGMDAVSLLTQLASDEIIVEMNRRFIDMVEVQAILGGSTVWNYNTADGRWEIEKYQNLCAKISRTSREIAKSTRRGQGNFMIVDTSTLSALEMSGKLSTANVDPMNQSFVGIFNGYIKVFVDIHCDETQILMGYKGSTELDAGIFYCPYIPLQVTMGYTQEGDQPRLFFRMRYGLINNPFGASNYYRKIDLQNLPS